MATKELVRARGPQATDEFGDPTGPVSTWVNIPGTTVVPRESQDYEQRGPIIISGFMLRLPSTAQVTDQHEYQVRGKIYQTDGAVADYGRKGKIVYVRRAN
jgi:hypothetical protein